MKVLYSVGLLALIAGTTISFQSCNKIKDELAKQIPDISFDGESATFTVPVMTATGTSSFIGWDTSTVVNINEVIEENAAGLGYSIDNFSTIKIDKITLHLSGTDESNNWTNFESAGAYFATDKSRANGKPDVMKTVEIADIAANQNKDVELSLTDTNLKDYFNGGDTRIYVLYSATPRRSTTHPMTVTATVKYTLIP
jgi:hypothetical protein